MTFDQYAIVLILVVMLIVYATERFRVEMVAMVGLAAAVLLDVVPVGGVFGGFASPAVITVIEVLVIVAALAQTQAVDRFARAITDRRSEEHTSELQSLMRISYAVFCLKKKNHKM